MRFTSLFGRSWYAALVLVLFGCIGAPGGPTPTPNREQLQAQPTPTPPAYREPVDVLTRDTLPSVEYVGRLEAPADSGSVFAHAFSTDGTRLAGLSNTSLMAWDVLNGERLYSLSADDQLGVFYSPDKTELYTLDRTGTVAIYDGETGTRQTALSVHPDYTGGPYAYHAPSGVLAVVSIQGDIRLWNLLERQAIANIQTDNPDITALTLSEDGERVAVGDRAGRTAIWDWRSEEQVAALVDEDELPVVRLAFPSNGDQIAVATAEDIRVWSLPAAELAHVLLTGQDGSADALTYTQDARWLINAGLADAMNIWNTQDGELALALPELGGEPTAIDFSPDGDLMLSSVFQGDVIIWDLDGIADGDLPRARLDVNANIIDVAWSPDGRALALFEAGGAVQVWGVPAPSENPAETDE